MYRAQGILKEWKKNNTWDEKRGWRYCRLYDFIEFQYQKYLELCRKCCEKSIHKGEWLRQVITEEVKQ